MTDLTDFLLARIAEDQANATAQAQLISDRYGNEPYDKYESKYRYEVDRPSMTVDHRYVMADCAAKRALIAIHQPYDPDSSLCAGCDGKWAVNDCPNLAVLAVIYADHPDYRDEWRP